MKKGLRTKLALLSLISVMTVSTVMAAPYENIVQDKLDPNVTAGVSNGAYQINHGGASNVRIYNNDWQKFGLNSGETANFVFNNHNSISVNRVTGTNMSAIYGTINATGAGAASSHIILSNPNGLLFGAGSKVNVNSFTATTHDNIKVDGEFDQYGRHTGKTTITIEKGKNGQGELAGKVVLEKGAHIGVNRSAAIIADSINVDGSTITKNGLDVVKYKDSLLTVNNGDNGTEHSNVKLVTADGVSFVVKDEYQGAIENGSLKITKDDASKAHAINITNGSNISAGSIQMYAGGSKDSKITVDSSTLKGVKLVNFALGDIAIVSKGKVTIKDSHLATVGSYQQKDGKITASTYSEGAGPEDLTRKGGTISVSGDYGVELDGATLVTDSANVADKDALTGSQNGGVQIASNYGNIDIKNNTNISAYGSVYMYAKGDVNASDSRINAYGIQGKKEINGQVLSNGFANQKALAINAGGNVNLKNTTLKSDSIKVTAAKDININNVKIGKGVAEIAKAEFTSIKGSVKTASNSTLTVNNNKLVVRAENGDANLHLASAANQKAGVEVYAKNTTLNAVDGTLSIARVETDTLNLNANNKFIADNNAKTAVDGRAYIQVRKDGGFNLDSKPEYVGKNTDNVKYESYSNEIKDENGNVIAYARHSMTLNNDAPFTLDYNKPVEPAQAANVTYSDLTRLPLQAANPTLASKITNNMTDPASGVIAAAAAIEIDEDEQLDY